MSIEDWRELLQSVAILIIAINLFLHVWFTR